MKLVRLAMLISGAAIAVFAPPANAQQVITPQDITGLGQHFVTAYSVSPADESIAFSLALPLPPNPSDAFFSVNLWTTTHRGTTSRQITNFADELEASVMAPAWNVDGFVAYLVRHETIPSGARVPPGPELAVTTFGNITPSSLHVEGFSWSLTQDTLAFAARDDDQQGSEFRGNAIYTVAINGAGLQKIVDCDSGFFSACGTPQWSPTENVIAYERGGDIHLVNPDGSGEHVAIPDGGNPVWSPLTGLIAFQCDDDVCIASGDGAGRVNITNGQSGLAYSEPAWAADEALIAVVGRPSFSGTPGDLYLASLDGTTFEQATNTSDASAPQWSPILPSTNEDGELIPFELFYVCSRNNNDDLCLITGPVSPFSCDATSCAGCCSQGVCLPGTTAAACGRTGNTCTTCPGGQVCNSLGVCANPTACGISSCSGCCDSSNVCHAGTSAQACGRLGEPCARCSSNQICTSDQGICETQLCSAANCSGCCGSDGKCHQGTDNSACGANGFACQACASGSRCTPSRICETQGCDISNCASGCCDNGVCRSGTSSSACGYSGFACVSCGGQACDPNSRTCVTPQTCTAANCSGCCAGNQCQPGNTASSCGGDGFVCQACNTGEQCSAGFCQ